MKQLVSEKKLLNELMEQKPQRLIKNHN